MKIVQINTSDNQGGAARAAYRLHKGLRHIGQDSRMLCRQKILSDLTTEFVQAERSSSPVLQDSRETGLAAIQSHYINTRRTPLSNTLFSLPYPGLDLSQLPQVRQADIINLHWVAAFQSPVTIRRLLELGKPVVWTLHDMWAFTGGCHYSAECDKYQTDCSACPQLFDDSYDLAAMILQDKLNCFADYKFTVVTPSEWLADCARRSQLFSHQRIEVIPYSLEVEDIFTPGDKAEAKQQLGIDADTVTLLFGAETAVEARKGFAELVEAMEHCLTDENFCQWVAAGKVKVLCFGQPSELLTSLAVPVQSVGSIASDKRLSQIYAAADLFVLPSLEDNFPNTMLEAMSCGTPVVGFAVGGIPDLVKDWVTGRTVPAQDTQKLAQAILDCIFDSNQRQQMGQASRQLMEQQYSIEKQAQRYLELYQDLRGSEAVSSPLSSVPANGSVTVPLETAVGSHFAQAVNQLSLEAITTKLHHTEKESFEQIEHLQATASERLALIEQLSQAGEERLALIEQLTQSLKHHSDQIAELHQVAAQRQQAIDRLTTELQQQSQSSEQIVAQLQQRLNQSQQMVDRLQQKVERSKQRGDRLKEERDQAQQTISQLEHQVGLLSTGKGALKTLWRRIQNKAQLFN